ILRRESGAVISDEEFENANVQYFPVPGDSPEVIAQKRRNRENAIEGLRIGSGDGAAYVERNDPAPETPQETPQPNGEPVTITDDAGYDALPSGAEFIAPDGTRRRKP
ncbi:MAG: hypothetical protein ACPGSI_18995, partial [Pikeienuella sp.]